MVKRILIESQYFPPIEYFTLISRFEEIIIEVCENFQKQTYRNRCYILGSNKVLPLVVPVSKNKGRRMDQIEIDHTQGWLKDHWRAIESSYNKSPFFMHYKDEVYTILSGPIESLLDLNQKILTFCLRKLDYNISVQYSTEYVKEVESDTIRDFRGAIIMKKDYKERPFLSPSTYYQMFGKTFVPNLSILDLLFCEGPYSRTIIESSYRSLNN